MFNTQRKTRILKLNLRIVEEKLLINFIICNKWLYHYIYCIVIQTHILHVELLNNIKDFCKIKKKLIDNNEIDKYYENLTTFGTAKCKDIGNSNKKR